MTKNPIELLINLAVNDAKSKENVDSNIQSLQKHYANNPLMLNLDFDKTKALNNIQNFIKEASKGAIDLDLNVKGDALSSVSGQTKKLKDEFKELSDIASKSSGKGNKAFDIDLDRTLVQLENLGRKGIVAGDQIAKFQQQINALRNTNDKVSLKNIIKDIFDVTSGANHADKVMVGLSESLIKVGQAEQSLSNIKDKFNVDATTNDSYIKLDTTINKLKEDLIKLQTTASSGGSDQIKLAEQMRDVENRIKEATSDMKAFNSEAKQASAVTKLAEDANKFATQMEKVGQVGTSSISHFKDEIASIAQSSESSATKLRLLNQVMDEMNTHAKTAKVDVNLANQIDLASLAIDKLDTKLIRLGNTQSKNIKTEEYDKLVAKVQLLAQELGKVDNSTKLAQVTKEYKQLSNEIDKVAAHASKAGKEVGGFAQQLIHAGKNLASWAGASAMLYAPIAGVKDLTEKVVELDTALISIKRVMDAPSYVFDGLVQDMIKNVDMLAGKTADYMQLVGDFARTGMDVNQSQAMADTATMLQNISEISASESINSLVSAMVAFNIEAKDSIQIADKLNEVDNNFAISTKDLALGLNKAASTAKTFGVELDTLLGYETAIGVQTRESGSTIGNSLKTIFSRMTTNGDAIKAMREIGVATTDSAGQVKKVSVIFDELADKWDKLSDAERQNTAIKVAGTTQVSRFLALMNGYDTAMQASTTAAGAAGSAMREQEKYAESLQARINRLQNAWYGLGDAAGKGFLSSGITVTTSILQSLTEDSSSLISKIGLLGPIFGIAGMAITAFNKPLRESVINFGSNMKAAVGASTATTLFGKASAGATVATRAFGTALKGLMASTGVGLALVAVGMAVEKLMDVMADGIEQERKFEEAMQKSQDAMGKNKETTMELVDEYKRLANAKENGSAWNDEKEQQYLQVQTQLSESFPVLVDHIDASGQAYLKSSEAIDKMIAGTEELNKANATATALNAAKELESEMEKLNGKWYDSLHNYFYGSFEEQIAQQKRIIDAMKKNGADDGAMAKQEAILVQFEMQAKQASENIKQSMYGIAQSFNQMNDLTVDPEVQKSLEQFVDTLDLSNLNSDQMAAFAQEFSRIQGMMSQAMETGNSSMYADAVKQMNELATQAKKTGKETATFKTTYEDMGKALDKGKKTLDNNTDGMNEYATSTEEATKQMESFKTVQEQLAGVSTAHTEKVKDLMLQYEMLTLALKGHSDEELKALQGKENLTDEEKLLVSNMNKRLAVMDLLKQIYPELNASDSASISLSQKKRDAIELENKANQMLIEGYKLAADGKLTDEQKATLASTQGTMDRINNIKAEIAALDILRSTAQAAYDEAKAKYDKGKDPDGRKLYAAGHNLQVSSSQQSSYIDELERLQASLGGATSAMSSFVDIEGKSGKTSKSSNKDKEQSVYITDKYKKAMDELNLAIEKQKLLQDEQRKGSNIRRAALVKEIELETQKLALMKQQDASIQKQIASGKIQQTGNVKVTGSAAGQKIGGAFDGTITSHFGERADNHRGTDIASAKGTAINSPTSGKVIKAGDAKSQGMHWSYGNVVVVQDSSGMKHIMAHMEKVMTKVGDQITAGTQIGTVGSTGNSTGNHLHYELNTASGQVVDSSAAVNAIRSGKTLSAGASGTTGGAEAIDKAIADGTQIKKDIMGQEKLLRQLQAQLVEENLQNFENRKIPLDNTIQNSANNMKAMKEESEGYRKELDKTGKALLDKRKVNQEELVYLQNVVAKGNLSDEALATLETRLQSLKNENAQIDFAINDNYLAKVASLNKMLDETISKYEKIRQTQDTSIELQTANMKELDSTSLEYLKALDGITASMRNKQAANRKELQDITTLINNGKYYGEALDNARARVEQLQIQIKNLQIDIQNGDFEIIVGIKNQGDEQVKDIEYEMSRLEEIRKMYEQGSGDYLQYTGDLIKEQQKLADSHLATRDALKAELQQRDITKDRIREVKRLLEQEHIAYLQATNAVRDYTKQLEEANKANKEDIANKVVAALKAAYQELRDEHMKALDEIAKKEQEAHNQRLKDLKDEQDTFKKNIEERLRLIDRQESQRSYDMEIADMEKERSKIQERMYTISKDDSYAAKKERKQLQEQLDKIDKDIAEKRHGRDIELQKQGLSDLGEMKDQEIQDRTEAENKAYDDLVDQLNKNKAYWEKYYTDLLNDERKFTKMSEDIMAGHFDEVERELGDLADKLKATMPQLADTLGGTMQAVGTAIRQNVIDQLETAMQKMREFTSMQSNVSNSFVDNVGQDIGNISTGNGSVGTSKGNLSQADLQVLTGKFLYDKVAPALSGAAQTSARSTGSSMAQQGYKGGSSVDSSLSFGSAINGLTAAEMETFKQYLNQNLGMSGGAYDSYIKQFTGGNSDIYNNTNRFGVQTPMSYADMQVMLAKYMREYLISGSTPEPLKNEVKAQADGIATSGRSAGSKISSDVTYQQVLASLDSAQRGQLKSFLGNQSGIIKNQDLQNKMRSYAASLDTGGMLNFSGQGVDGKGGKFIVAHDGEVVNNPIETQNLLDTVDAARVTLQHLKGIVQPLQGLVASMNSAIGGSTQESYEINFNGDFVNVNKTMMNNMAGSFMDAIRTKKGTSFN